MFIRLVLLFVTLPCLELFLLIKLGHLLGALPTFAIILLTGILGATLARHEGMRALSRIRQAVAAGRVPATEVVDGFLILVAGLVLLTPGFITDSVGFLLLIAPIRKVAKESAMRYFRRHFRLNVNPVSRPGRDAADTDEESQDYIDVSADVLDDDA